MASNLILGLSDARCSYKHRVSVSADISDKSGTEKEEACKTQRGTGKSVRREKEEIASHVR